MTVSMGVLNRRTDEYHVVPIACSVPFRKQWRPLAKRLNLTIVKHLDDGRYAPFPAELIPDLLQELETLRKAVKDDDKYGWIADRCDTIIARLNSTDPETWEYDFG